MRKFLGNYNPVYTKTFEKQINELHPKFRKQIEQHIQDLVIDPWHNTKFLKAQYRGKRRLWLNRSDRLVFVICEECRELDHFIYNQCEDCESIPENTLKVGFIIFGHKY